MCLLFCLTRTVKWMPCRLARKISIQISRTIKQMSVCLARTMKWMSV